MKLPEIEVAQPAPSAAPAYEKMGAEIRQAGNAWGDYFLQQRKTELLLENQKARNKLFDSLQQAHDIIQSNPALPADVVRRMFNGTPPPDVKLTDTEMGPDGRPVEVDRAAVETHTFAPQLFEKMAKEGLDAATSGITAKGWADKFRAAAEGDISRAREVALDWARGQRLALNSLKAEGEVKRAIAERAWGRAAQIISDPVYGLDRKVALQYQNELPRLQVVAGIEDRLRLDRVDALQALQQDIQSNNFPVKLSADDQLKFLGQARAAEDRVVQRAEHAERMANQRLYERTADQLQVASRIPYGPQRLEALSKFQFPLSLKQEQVSTLLHFRDYLSQPPTEKEQKPDPHAWKELNAMVENGTFILMSQAELLTKYLPRLGREGFQTWSDRHAKALRGEEGRFFSPTEVEAIELKLKAYGFEKSASDPGKRDLFETAKALVEQNLITLRKQSQTPFLTYDVISQEVARTMNTKDDYGNLILGSKTPKQLTDKVGIGAASVLMKLARDRKGGIGTTTVSLSDMIVERDRYMKMKGPIEEAWKVLNPNQTFSDVEGATVYAMITNQPDVVRLQQQVKDEGKDPENLTTLIHRAVTNMHEEISTPAREEIRARVERDVVRRQVEDAAKQQRESARMIQEGEEARWKGLPYEERAARTNAWRDFSAGIERSREAAQARAQKILERSKPASAALRDVPPDPVLVERLAQESLEREKLYAKAEAEFRAALEKDMEAYRAYLATVKGYTVLRYEDWKRTR